MNPIEDANFGAEREWDSFSIVRANFRPHWNGDLVNLTTLIHPRGTLSVTNSLVEQCTVLMAGWVLVNRDRFGPEDHFQIVVGLPRSIREVSRQIVKTGGTYQELSEILARHRPVPLNEGWHVGIF